MSAEEFLLTTRMQISKTTSVAGAFKMRSVLKQICSVNGERQSNCVSTVLFAVDFEDQSYSGLEVLSNDIVVLLAMSCPEMYAGTMLIEFLAVHRQ